MRGYLVIAAILIVAALIYLGLRTHATDVQSATETEKSPLAVSTRASAPVGSSRAITSSLKAAESSQARDEYVCRVAKHLCLNEPLLAASEAEAAWLIGSGYPSPRRAEELAALGTDELRARAARDDLAAEVYLGKALLAEGDVKGGMARIADASAKGSIYASYALAEAHRADGPSPDGIESAAYYRLAFLQGDWKATAKALSSPTQLSALEQNIADRRAMTLYRNLLDEKGRSGYKLIIAPRPD